MHLWTFDLRKRMMNRQTYTNTHKLTNTWIQCIYLCILVYFSSLIYSLSRLLPSIHRHTDTKETSSSPSSSFFFYSACSFSLFFSPASFFLSLSLHHWLTRKSHLHARTCIHVSSEFYTVKSIHSDLTGQSQGERERRWKEWERKRMKERCTKNQWRIFSAKKGEKQKKIGVRKEWNTESRVNTQ